MTGKKISLAICSGLMLTGSFPKANMEWLAWIALVPLLIALSPLCFRKTPLWHLPVQKQSVKESFRLGFLTGCIHYLTLIYWLVHTMKIYGGLPLYVCVPVLFLFSVYLALYVAFFSMSITWLCRTPVCFFIMIPILWVSLEYIRSFLFSGFPWELIGYSQFKHLHLIQISDIFGVYGISFLIVLTNGAVFLFYLYLTKNMWQGREISLHFIRSMVIILVLIFVVAWSYGKWRVNSIEKENYPSIRVAIIQGNIDQTIKWDPAFQYSTTEKYINLSRSAKGEYPDLIVWPETATPFYFTYHNKLTEWVMQGIQETGTHFLIGSPSFVRNNQGVIYFNSAYLIQPDGKTSGKYDKAHLVPFGEYVPFKKWLPFLGKIVEHVGDFRAGKKGKTLTVSLRGFENLKLGVQICYEIIFPNLSRMMVKNDASFLTNITNDAWYGRTSAPYQHFSMVIFRAVENKRAIIRSANTGISGFISPVGRIIASTPLFEDVVITREIPLIQQKTFYTRFGDIFAAGCLIGCLVFGIWCFVKKKEVL